MARDLAHEGNSAGTESENAQKTVETAESTGEGAGKGILNRRNYLRLGAAAAATVAGASATSTTVAAASDNGMNFDRTVNAVKDLGWDPSGDRPVTDSLQRNMVDGTLIEVPPGTYLVNDVVSAYGLTNWGVRGTGSMGDARFVAPQGKAQRIFNVNNGRNILLENFTFDMYDTWETCIGNALKVQDNLVVKDIEYAGKTPHEHTGATALLNVYIFDPDGTAVLDGVRMEGPSELTDYPSNPLAVFCGGESKGTLYIRNCRFANRGEHAIYASRCEGDVRIENCWFKNNQNTQARISGEGSYVKNSTFVWDVDGHPNKGEFQATTGMTFEGGYRGYTGGLVEGCEFICKSSAPNSGCLKVDGSHGGITVRDCTFQIDADGAEPIWADAPGDSHMIDGLPDKPWDITLENVHVHGTGKSHRGNTGTIEIQGRDGTCVQNCCVSMEGDRDGVYFTNLSGEVTDTNIVVPGEAIALEGADAKTSNITHQACSLLSDDDSTARPSYANTLTVFAETGADAFEYAVTVDGKAALTLDGEYAATDASANGGVGETITTNDDGTVTVSGIVADGGGDSFTYEGRVVDFQAGGPARLVRNGEEVDIGLLIDPDTINVFAEEGAEAFTYAFDVDGSAELVLEGEYAATDASTNGGVGETITENDDGTVTVSGIVADGSGDSFRTHGDIVDFRADGPATVVLNGDVVDVGLLTDAETVRVFAKAGAEAFTYEFDVAGSAKLVLEGENAATDASANGGVGEKVVENDDGTVTVSGIVADGSGDSFRTHGDIIAFRTNGSPVVYRDGERFDWQHLGLPRTLSIDGGETVSRYTVTVSGDIAPNPHEGSFDSADAINGSMAEGAVKGGLDSYLFSGSITDFSLSGNATVYVDGEQVDPESLGLGHQLEVVGTGSPANYGLTVSGELAHNPDATVESDDVIDGRTATGSVSTEADKFLFSGEVTAFELQGDAAVYLDGAQVDPARLTSGTDPVLANRIVVRGAGTEAGYTFDVSGNVEKAPDLADVETEDTITAKNKNVETVAGTVADDDDGYRFSGNLTRMKLDGSASITFADLDG